MTRESDIAKLIKWDDLYHNLGKPEVTDTEYDIFRTECEKKYPDDPYFRRVGAPINSKYEEIELPYIMGGLDKQTAETVDKWFKKKPKDGIVAGEKLDGRSIMCTWSSSGQLIFAAGRGDGNMGQNLLQKAKHFVPNIPKSDRAVTLRGEAVLEGNVHLELGFANRRNGVAGLIRRDDIVPADLKKVGVIFYEVIQPDDFKSETERLGFIKSLGLRIIKSASYSAGSLDSDILCRLLAIMKEEADYDVDGLVLTFENTQRENVLQPQYKVKFKVNEDAIRCPVVDIEWSVTRTGLIKPVTSA